jgi:transposase
LEKVTGQGTQQVRPMLLDPYKVFIRQVLEQHPQLTATRIYEMVKARGYPAGVVQVRRFVRKVRPASRAEAYLRLATLPGEQAQVDWGLFGKLTVGQAKRTLSCFVLVLSHSRAADTLAPDPSFLSRGRIRALRRYWPPVSLRSAASSHLEAWAARSHARPDLF